MGTPSPVRVTGLYELLLPWTTGLKFSLDAIYLSSIKQLMNNAAEAKLSTQASDFAQQRLSIPITVTRNWL